MTSEMDEFSTFATSQSCSYIVLGNLTAQVISLCSRFSARFFRGKREGFCFLIILTVVWCVKFNFQALCITHYIQLQTFFIFLHTLLKFFM